MTATNDPPRNLWRSAAAVFPGFITVAVLSLGTDQVLHVLHVYPPWNQIADRGSQIAGAKTADGRWTCDPRSAICDLPHPQAAPG